MQNKVLKALRQIQNVAGLSEDEKVLFARSLAATPDERWQMHENFLRSLGLHKLSAKKAFVSK